MREQQLGRDTFASERVDKHLERLNCRYCHTNVVSDDMEEDEKKACVDSGILACDPTV